MKNILYISSNDGSDMRINKEINSLTKEFHVIFIGVGDISNSYLNHENLEVKLVHGKRNSPITLLKKIALTLKILATRRIDSIHVINEQLMVFFYPILFFKPTVLDVFDSIFLKYNMESTRYDLIKRFVYAPVNVIIVTDEPRKQLLPNSVQKKTIILENYPNKYIPEISNSENPQGLTILFNGWLGMKRGGRLVKGILETNDVRIKIIMAGWFVEDEARDLTNHPQVEFKGVMPQRDALNLAATKADYIVCVYAPENTNNIYASPNKVYDSVHTETPLIINREAKVSEFVREHNIGFILDSYYDDDFPKIIEHLIERKSSYSFPEKLKEKCSWESIDARLLDAHKPK